MASVTVRNLPDETRRTDPLRVRPTPLTPAQRRVLACLQQEWTAGRKVDSLDALCGLLGVRSRGALHRHIEALVQAGEVAPLGRNRFGLLPPVALPLSQRRTAPAPPDPATRPGSPGPDGWPLKVPGETLRALPRLGRIAAGAPLDAVFEEDPVLVPERLVPRGEAYVLEVQGDSMSGDGILDGDLVVVEVDAHVRAGEIAVVLIAGEGATLKRFRQEGEMLWLIPSNPDYPARSVLAAEVAIQGRVSGLMRSYRT